MKTERAVLAGGCFWGMQDLIRRRDGVISTRVGYTGGDVPHATYRNHRGHAEAIEVIFDPSKVTYRDLLEFFFQIHDPTTLNSQGNDIGTSYRSAIFYHTPEQQQTAEARIAELNAAQIWNAPIVTEVVPLREFYPGEAYHQGYFRANPGQGYCQAVVAPKVAKFRKQFAGKIQG